MPGKWPLQAGGEGSTGSARSSTEGLCNGTVTAPELGRAECGGQELGGGYFSNGDERWSCGSERQSCTLGKPKELLRFGLSLEVGDPAGGDRSCRLGCLKAGYLCRNGVPSFAIPSSIQRWRWAHTANHAHQL